ncbi:MAG: cobalt-precorrin-5B (C(1))-methyltransferase CbiD [Gemmiger sp.]|nr:cobalt-precorrin-5B (C(1))-methyltransferase CbiD [Gemmiger sp.]
MAFEYYLRSGQKLLRCGYTTGSCAALAAAGATRLLLVGTPPATLALVTPKGVRVEVAPAFCRMEGEAAVCAVTKDGGDDADATSGLQVVATVRRTPAGITLEGGAGVGRVTKPGLDQPVGAAAINHVPRQMIVAQAQNACDAAGYAGGVAITISIPGGEAVARRTFNPVLGVEGGLSVLGTSGIVEPMSEQAIVDTIALAQRQAAATGATRLLLTPGNYGTDFLRETGMDGWGIPVVKCSNFVGEALDIAAATHFAQVVLVGHIGKLVKLAGGVMNTHSRYADCRTELLCAHAAVCGGGQALCRALLAAPTTDACLALLDEAHLRGAVLQSLLGAIQTHLERRVAGAYQVGAVLFSNQYGPLGQTETAKEILAQWQQK